MGLYHSVCLTGVFTHLTRDLKSQEQIQIRLYKALAKVILEYPQLAYLIINEDSKAEFHIAEKVDLDNHVLWVDTEDLTNIIEVKFDTVAEIPPWRLLVHKRSNGFCATFKFHHAIGDGTTGKLFLETLTSALNETANEDALASSSVIIPDTVTVEPSLEEATQLSVGLWTTAKLLATTWGLISPGPKYWNGSPVPESITPLPTARIEKFSLDNEIISTIQKKCKSNKTSVTSLLTAALTKALYDSIEDKENIKYTIPRNLRSLNPEYANKMGVFVCSIEGIATPEQVTDIWELSRDIKAGIEANVAQGTRDLNTGLLKYVSNMWSFINGKLGKPRNDSFEISSLLLTRPTGLNNWSMEEVTFTQCVSVCGSPLAVSVAGFKGEKLNLTCTWGTGYIKEEIAMNTIENFKQIVEQTAHE